MTERLEGMRTILADDFLTGDNAGAIDQSVEPAEASGGANRCLLPASSAMFVS
jgi:hypothetical protein